MMLEQKIKDTLAKVEEAGEEGRVDEAQVLTDQVEKMQQDLQHLKQVKRGPILGRLSNYAFIEKSQK